MNLILSFVLIDFEITNKLILFEILIITIPVSLIAFNSFVGYLFGSTNRLINVNIQIQKSLVALRRVQKIFDLPEEKTSLSQIIIGDIKMIEFKNVSFDYDNNKKVLEDISFEIEQGEKIGIVGNSGSGKTTFIRLLSGLYEVNSGKILLNGIN